MIWPECAKDLFAARAPIRLERGFRIGAYAGEEAVRRRLIASKPQAERYAEDVMRVWSAWIDMDKFHPKTYSGESGQGRSFHRLGIAIAGAIIAVGLALIGAAISRLDLF